MKRLLRILGLGSALLLVGGLSAAPALAGSGFDKKAATKRILASLDIGLADVVAGFVADHPDATVLDAKFKCRFFARDLGSHFCFFVVEALVGDRVHEFRFGIDGSELLPELPAVLPVCDPDEAIAIAEAEVAAGDGDLVACQVEADVHELEEEDPAPEDVLELVAEILIPVWEVKLGNADGRSVRVKVDASGETCGPVLRVREKRRERDAE